MIEESKHHFDEVWNADFDKIWSFTDENDFVTGMYSYLCRKPSKPNEKITVTATKPLRC